MKLSKSCTNTQQTAIHEVQGDIKFGNDNSTISPI